MIRRWQRGLVLAAVAAAVVSGVLLATRPWGGEEAAGATIQWRMCDTVLEAPIAQPGPQTVLVGRRLVAGEEPTFKLRLLEVGGGRSEVSIDANTGTVLRESYADSSQEATLQEIIQTVRLEPLDPETAGWPYTDASQLSSEPKEQGAFSYREPDPASGIQVVLERAHLLDTTVVHTLHVANCRSLMFIVNSFGKNLEGQLRQDQIHPEDKAAFDTFRDQVQLKGLEP